LYINYNGGFSGNISDLKYFNYAIWTFEINSINSKGPNLKTKKDSNISKSKPPYLSSQWYFNDTDVLTWAHIYYIFVFIYFFIIKFLIFYYYIFNILLLNF
jgi:hypothetical protein